MKSQKCISETGQSLATSALPILYYFSSNFSPTMQHPDDIDMIVGKAIKGKVVSDDQMANSRSDIISRETRKRMKGKLEPAAFNGIMNTVSGDGAILRDL